VKATIDSRGTLIIEAESELESYALKAWWRNYRAHEIKPEPGEEPGSTLLITSTEVRAETGARR